MKNIIESQLSEADRTSISNVITDLEESFAGKTGTLSAEERKRYGSVNEQNKLVVNKAREFYLNQPGLSAPDVDWVEFEKDFQARLFLEKCIDRLTAIIHKLESTKIMHDYDNFQDALKDYGYSQYRFGAGEDDYTSKVNDYKLFFTRAKPDLPEENGDGGGNPP